MNAPLPSHQREPMSELGQSLFDAGLAMARAMAPAVRTPSMADMTIGQLRDVLLYSEDKLERARAVTWFEMRVEQRGFKDAAEAVRGAL